MVLWGIPSTSKPMSINEWTMMKDDLEKEMVGLAQDIVRRNIGFGNKKYGDVPPKVLYDFIVIKKYAQSVLVALLDIVENPRCEIATQYKKVVNNKNCRLDEESIKGMLLEQDRKQPIKFLLKLLIMIFKIIGY